MQYPMFKVHMPVDEVMPKIRSVLASGFLNEGTEVDKFSKKLSSYLNVKNLVLLNSCTSALTIAYRLAGVKPGKEVICTSMTCVASNTPIINLGGKIVWSDVNPETGAIEPNDIIKKITSKTCAISFVNWGGNPAELEKISKIGEKYNIKIIQDSAHAFGSKFKGKDLSYFADFTTYSFQAIKHLTTGDGGALICKDNNDYLSAKKLKWFGYDRDNLKDKKGDWKGQRWDADIDKKHVGYKFNMNNISAAIGLVQLNYIDRLIEKNKKNANIYQNAFNKSNIIKTIKLPNEATSSYWVYTCLFKGGKNKRDLLIEKLISEGIAAGLVHIPNHKYSAFEDFYTNLPGTKEFSDHQISLPCGWWLTEKNCEHIASRVKTLSNQIIN